MNEDESAIVISVDPGKVSGVAIVIVTPGWVDLGPVAEVPAERAAGYVDVLVKGHRDLADVHLVVEQFIMTPGYKSPAPWSLEVIGALKHVARERGVSIDVTQKPDDAKLLFTDDALRELGMHSPSPGGHQNDAVRHALRYVLGRGWFPDELKRRIIDSVAGND